MNYIQELLARAAAIRTGLTREDALAGIAEVTGHVMPVVVESANQGDAMPHDPEEELDEEEDDEEPDDFSDVDEDAAADQEERDEAEEDDDEDGPEENAAEDCSTCGGTGWLDDPSDGGTMNCDDCDGTGKEPYP